MAGLELSLFGSFHVSVNGSPVTAFDTDKARALLIYLSVEFSRPHARETLAALLWPDVPDEAALRNLRHSLFKLRQTLGLEGDPPAFLHITPQTVQIDPAQCRLDCALFGDLITACKSHRHRKPIHCAACHTRLQRASELYRGDFLAGFQLSGCQAFEEWRVLKREAFHRDTLYAFVRLAGYHQARGEYEQALHYAYRELELEPWREEAHTLVMQVLNMTGRRSEALAQYAACQSALARELNAEPSEETVALFGRIKAGDMTGSESVAPRHNLPRQLSPFIGRDDELDCITEQLDGPDYGLVTIIGPGGVGKTRLAVESASRQMGAFDDGVFWVPLAAATSSELATSSIAQAVGLRLQADEDPAVQLLNYVRDREILLVLDNFEQLLSTDGATGLVEAILRSAPRTYVIVTSRERLGLQEEFLLDLSGLSFPTGDSLPAEFGGIWRGAAFRGASAAGPARLHSDRRHRPLRGGDLPAGRRAATRYSARGTLGAPFSTGSDSCFH